MDSRLADESPLPRRSMISCRDIDFLPDAWDNRKRTVKNRPPSVSVTDWKKRYLLFSRFDKGIQMDHESWYEVTPENLAIYVAARVPIGRTIIDGCCGIGGNAIQFAQGHKNVCAVDLSESRLRMCRANAKIYGVGSKVEIVREDMGTFLSRSPADTNTVFHISPPWGGRECYDRPSVRIDELPMNLVPIIALAMEKCGSIILYLPRNIDLDHLSAYLFSLGVGSFELEGVFYTEPVRRLKCYYAYIEQVPLGLSSILSSERAKLLSSLSCFCGRTLTATILRKSFIQVDALLGTRIVQLLAQSGKLPGIVSHPPYILTPLRIGEVS